jgi:hypothetical protein
MANTMLTHPWLKFTDIPLFNEVICALTTNVDVSDPWDQISVPCIDVCSIGGGFRY